MGFDKEWVKYDGREYHMYSLLKENKWCYLENERLEKEVETLQCVIYDLEKPKLIKDSFNEFKKGIYIKDDTLFVNQKKYVFPKNYVFSLLITNKTIKIFSINILIINLEIEYKENVDKSIEYLKGIFNINK